MFVTGTVQIYYWTAVSLRNVKHNHKIYEDGRIKINWTELNWIEVVMIRRILDKKHCLFRTNWYFYYKKSTGQIWVLSYFSSKTNYVLRYHKIWWNQLSQRSFRFMNGEHTDSWKPCKACPEPKAKGLALCIPKLFHYQLTN